MNLITNRTAQYLQLSKSLNKKAHAEMTSTEKAEYNNSIGSYRHTDMNRVGDACAELYQLLTSAGYEVSGYSALKTDWTDEDTPSWADLQKYLATVASIKAVLPTQTPIPTTMRKLTINGANNIEKLLNEVDSIFYKMKSVYLFSQTLQVRSTSYCGYAVYIPEYKDPFDFNAVDFTYLSFGL